MKNIIAAILAAVLVFSLAACEGEKIPEDNSSTPDSGSSEISKPEDPRSAADKSLCEKIISDFGAFFISNGVFQTPKGQPTAFDCGYFADASVAPAETYYYWLFHFSETVDKIESYPFGEKNGSAFSAELLEDYAVLYFGADIEHLRSSSLYSADEGIYKNETQAMHFGTPTELLSFECNGNILTIHIRQTVYDGERIRRSVITAETFDDGSYRILSYLPE